MGSCPSPSSAIEACLVSPSARTVSMLIRTPTRVQCDHPLDIELTTVGLGVCTGAVASSVARRLSNQALVTIQVELPGCPIGIVSLPVSVRPAGGNWTARALIHPASWADAASVTILSVALAGRPLSCDCLPVTLRVGYNHAPAPEGAVYAAAQAGDVVALQAALDAGGSTEEANGVRRSVVAPSSQTVTPLPPSPVSDLDWLDCIVGGRLLWPTRGHPHAPGSRRLPGRSRQGEWKEEMLVVGTGARLHVEEVV